MKTPRKIIAIAATIVLLLALTLTVIAKVNGYSNAWEYVTENFQKIFGLDAGDRMNDNGITLIKQDSVVSYDSIEELLQIEGYDILYPSELPDGIVVTKISQQIIDEDYILYSFQFTDSNLSVVVSTRYNISQEDLSNDKRLDISTLTTYLVKQESGIYQAVGYDNKYEYLFYCTDYDVLIKILNGMKGIEK